jgi:hypothetical protein
MLSKARNSGLQASYQAAFIVITLTIAILSGALTGLLLRRFNSVKVFFSDEENWEVPDTMKSHHQEAILIKHSTEMRGSNEL